MNFYNQFEARFEAFSAREKVLGLLAVLVVPCLVWDTFYFQDRNELIGKSGLEISSLQTKSTEINQKIQIAALVAAKDPDAATRIALSHARKSAVEMRNKLKHLTNELISPTAMAQVVREMLEHEERLDLVQLKSLGTKKLLDDKSDSADPYTGPMVFSHGIQLEFRGAYLDALAYLKRLEALPWRLYWDGFEFETLEYPQAKVRLEVHTLSLAEGWIGV